MSTIRLTKEFRFEAAHALEGYDGACSQIHGHSYRLLVTVEGEPLDSPGAPKDGMVMDFGVLKGIVNREIVDRLDHSFTIRRTADNGQLIEMLQRHYTNIHVVDWQPTSENMLHDMAARLIPAMPQGVQLVALKLYETATSSAELVL
ncbi:MAG: 6-carboxytetrahydropterin synthase [Rikenellaceae bacterium]|nr:6-carboxytetrahydropterin synthase [Rikenellaceae bacterium]